MKIAVTRERGMGQSKIAPRDGLCRDPGAERTTLEGITHALIAIAEKRRGGGHDAEDRRLAQEPADRRIATGRASEPKTETMPDGTVITYWRKIKMLATS